MNRLATRKSRRWLSARRRTGGAIRRAGFTLVELLVVVGIIVILLGLLTPAATSILKGTQLRQASDLVLSQLSLARQEALTRNQTIEVRFYQYATTTTPNEYRAMQYFLYSDTGVYTPLSNVQTLPSAILIDVGTGNSATTLSTLVGAGATSSTVPTLTTGATLNVPLPQAGTTYNASTFQFYRDGSTNLPITGGPWFLTIHNVAAGDACTTAPHDFFTITIDPTNGHLRTYRP